MAVLLTKGAQRRRRVRRVLDVVLSCLLLIQMGYQLMPEDLHAALGAAMTVIAGAHLAINGAWLRSLGRGRMTAVRAAFAIMACASLLLMLSLALSGLVLSELSPALRAFDVAARAAHLSSSYLALLVLPFHAGMHAAPFLGASALLCVSSGLSSGRLSHSSASANSRRSTFGTTLRYGRPSCCPPRRRSRSILHGMPP